MPDSTLTLVINVKYGPVYYDDPPQYFTLAFNIADGDEIECRIDNREGCLIKRKDLINLAKLLQEETE